MRITAVGGASHWDETCVRVSRTSQEAHRTAAYEPLQHHYSLYPTPKIGASHRKNREKTAWSTGPSRTGPWAIQSGASREKGVVDLFGNSWVIHQGNSLTENGASGCRIVFPSLRMAHRTTAGAVTPRKTLLWPTTRSDTPQTRATKPNAPPPCRNTGSRAHNYPSPQTTNVARNIRATQGQND